ncbi:DUF421 domain-containing protein [Orenia marismortui]|uniref:Uncharacterized membrane protein YcaP (DUF421 family) n=1 Tax=Orenia marismortui TaxID=46469 RepID=A0A4R8GSY5_9FIRM|nr:DUF421 domain-containing protein [Orenia marismortui]TDX49057.1 uncharacterized membrane protein YcaP (DUF421 family) [Orenia marismortui]
MTDFLSYLIRVILVYFFTYFGTRMLSKKAIAQMTAYEMAGVIVLTTVAAEPLVTKITTKALFGTGVLTFLIILTSKLTLIDRLTPILEHKPTVLVKDGQLDMYALKNMDLSLNQMKGLLRQKGYDKVSDVEYAILEPQGQLSVIAKSQKRPLQPSDLNISTQYEGLTVPLIIDGAIIERNLQHVKLTKEWLMGELNKQGIINYENEVNLAELDTLGNLLISKNTG